MPYNTTAIPPRKEVTGQTQLPLSRVKRIVGVDQDIQELFIQYIAEQGQKIAKAEKKPRRNVQYKDLAKAVNTMDNLEFLEDIIPATTPYKLIREEAANTRERLTGERFSEVALPGLNAVIGGAAVPGAAAAGNVNGTSPAKPSSSADVANGGRLSSSSNKEFADVMGMPSRNHMMENNGSVADEDPSAQLEAEARRGGNDEDEDVPMTG